MSHNFLIIDELFCLDLRAVSTSATVAAMAWLQSSETLHADAINRVKSQKKCSSSKRVVQQDDVAKAPEVAKSRAKAATVSAMAKRYRELITCVPEIARDERVRLPVGYKKVGLFLRCYGLPLCVGYHGLS